VFDDVYSGVGLTKLDARVNAAANAVDVLDRNGVVAAKQRETEAERREADWMKRHSEFPPPEIPRYDQRMFGQFQHGGVFICGSASPAGCHVIRSVLPAGSRWLVMSYDWFSSFSELEA